MTRRHLAWAVGALLIPFAGTGTALADGTSQTIGQGNSSSQSADADATSMQLGPSNQNIVVRVLSPGDDGNVTQSNSSDAAADASNTNTTGQSAVQQAAGGNAAQEIGQVNGNEQQADADATSTQIKPSNDNIVVRVLSPGDGGDVTQSNSSQAGAKAGNSNGTTQAAEQVAAPGCGCKGDVLQLIGQANRNKQSANADATSKQVKPSNSNIAVRVLSPGNDGHVKQSNSSKATAMSGNTNATDQKATQNAGGPSMAERCGCNGGLVLQATGQLNSNEQQADADATSTQVAPSNTNIPVRVLSPGYGGNVDQSNSSTADAQAGNRNQTGQQATQNAGSPKCGCEHADKAGLVIQAIGQENGNHQAADADATSEQKHASNVNAPVSIGGLGHAMPVVADMLARLMYPAGSVKQSNDSLAGSMAANANATRQGASQAA